MALPKLDLCLNDRHPVILYQSAERELVVQKMKLLPGAGKISSCCERQPSGSADKAVRRPGYGGSGRLTGPIMIPELGLNQGVPCVKQGYRVPKALTVC